LKLKRQIEFVRGMHIAAFYAFYPQTLGEVFGGTRVEEWSEEDKRGDQLQGRVRACLAVGVAFLVHDPASFRTQCLEDFVVVAMLGELVVPVRAQAREDLGRDGSSTPLPSLVVLPLLPSR